MRQVGFSCVIHTTQNYCFFQDWLRCEATQQPPLPDDHSESVPPLPIPNRTVKRLYADDSADSRVKVGNRQAPSSQKPPSERRGFLHFGIPKSMWRGVTEATYAGLLCRKPLQHQTPPTASISGDSADYRPYLRSKPQFAPRKRISTSAIARPASCSPPPRLLHL